MEKYLGVKIIKAEPAIKYADGSVVEERIQAHCPLHEGEAYGYKVVYEAWSPKDVFEKAYRRIDGLTFGLAIEALKQGKSVARKGWNGKGMFLILIYPYLNEQFEVKEKEDIVGTLLPYIAMKTADNGLVPWLASQTDMLSEDWVIVE